MCIYYRDVVTKGVNSHHDKLYRPQSLATWSESVSSIDSYQLDPTKEIGANGQIGVFEKADDSETRACKGIEDDETYGIEKKKHHYQEYLTKATNDAITENILKSTEDKSCRASLNECDLQNKIYKGPPNMRCNGVGLNKKFGIRNVREILLSMVNSIL